jgi:hypothetical protein
VIGVGGGVVWSTRRGVRSYCKSLNMREEGTGKVCGGGVGGEDFGQKVRTHANWQKEQQRAKRLPAGASCGCATKGLQEGRKGSGGDSTWTPRT